MRLLASFLLFFLLLSCSSDLNFNQIDAIKIEQNLVASAAHFKVDQTKFLNQTGTQEILEITDISVLDIFSPSYIQNNITKAVFEFETQNTFNRNFEIEISFLDQASQITQQRILNSNSNSQNKVQFLFEGAELTSLKSSNQISITIRLQPAVTILDINQPAQLELKSSATFTLVIN